MTDEQISKMKAAAEAATQGEWFDDAENGEVDSQLPPAAPDLSGKVMIARYDEEKDAAHIVAFQPQHALALLQEVERVRERAKFYQEQWSAASVALSDVSKMICRSSMPIAEQQSMLGRIDDGQRKAGDAGLVLKREVDRLRAQIEAAESCIEGMNYWDGTNHDTAKEYAAYREKYPTEPQK